MPYLEAMSAGRARGGVRRRPRAPRAFMFGLVLPALTAACTSGAASVPPDSTSAPTTTRGVATTGSATTSGATSGASGIGTPTTAPPPSGSGEGGTTTPIPAGSCPVPATAAPPSDRPGYNPADDLKALEALWLEKLMPFEERGYNARPKG